MVCKIDVKILNLACFVEKYGKLVGDVNIKYGKNRNIETKSWELKVTFRQKVKTSLKTILKICHQM